MQFKFHDDPTVNESEIVIFSETGLMTCGKKERVLGEEERKNEIGRQRRLRSQSENWLTMSLFITRGIHDLLFTLFIYFYYFIKKRNSILFSIKWIIKYSFYFLSNHYFIITIFLYLFNYKTSLFSKILYTKKNGMLHQRRRRMKAPPRRR